MRRRAVEVLVAVLLLVVLPAAWVLRGGPSAPPRSSLDEAIRLARAQRFDEAETLAARFLAAVPTDSRARLLVAQLQLSRSEPKATEALTTLEVADPDDRPLAALFHLERGKAHYYLGDYVAAERAWREALKLDPTVPEAGWALLDLYYVEGRSDEAAALAMKLRTTEPDKRDRILLLLELVRAEARPLAAPLVITRLERALSRNPEDLEALLGLGRAEIRDSKLDEAIARFETAVARAPERADVWDALLTGLDDAGKTDRFAAALERVPSSIRDDPRLVRHIARRAHNDQDWPNAAKLYRAAIEYRSDQPTVAYRLSRVLRALGDEPAAAAIEKRFRGFESAAKEVVELYEEADAIKTHGVEPQPALYRRLADLCERLGRNDQALGWYEHILESAPDDSEARAALDRLRSRRAEASTAAERGVGGER
ncbi:MAG: tetratricopeptide repeat protein [Isosphaeraceae bacterium]|nr:tetratricopeptide repeat protein [Isosphaeraceae bacterium]